MKIQKNTEDKLRQIPSVDVILEQVTKNIRNVPYVLVMITIRSMLKKIRKSIIDQTLESSSPEYIVSMVLEQIKKDHYSKYINLINGTGIILHTGLGRAPISPRLMQAVCKKITGYTNLELDISTGNRGERTDIVRTLFNALTDAESSLVVNNNAAAVLLMLNTVADGNEVIISRGEQVEIGGSFRIPDVIRKSGCIMKEIGSTNKTHFRDYENAVSDKTGAILVVHTSNYKIEGFTHKVELRELASLCKKKKLPLLMDLGSGALADLPKLGLPFEPQVRELIKRGCTVVTFSGDKLLGGPQAGLICGKKSVINRIHKNPLYRALRVDKITYALLEETLRTHYKPTEILPDNLTLFLFQRDQSELFKIAQSILARVRKNVIDELGIQVRRSTVEAGSGSLPTEKIPSVALVFSPKSISASKLSARFRKASPPILGYIHGNRFRIDLKAVLPHEEESISNAINTFEL